MKPEQNTLLVELGNRSYPICFAGLGRLREIPIANRKILLVADSTTVQFADQVQGHLSAAQEVSVWHFPAGEASKNMNTAVDICREALRLGYGRDAIFVALGGGVVGDLTGFAAAIFMRGVDFWQVPTTLLAMVDSSVGGKTGVDLPEGKNLLGAFHQPKAVFMEMAFLQSLPPEHLAAGMAEVIKIAAIFDEKFFACLEQGPDFAELPHNADFLRLVIRESCRLKAAVVARDEREATGSVRELLNFGHTFGHALEALSNYQLLHGHAVAWGIKAAARLAVRRQLMTTAEENRLQRLLAKYQLGNKQLQLPKVSPEEVLASMRSDKKNRGGCLRLVLPMGLGKAAVKDGLPESEVLATLQEVLHDS